MSIQVICPFLIRLFGFLLLNCVIFLDISPLSETWFAYIFSRSVGCVFISLIVSFFFNLFVLFIFGCVGSSLLCGDFL